MNLQGTYMDVGLWTLLDLVDLLGPITAHKTNEIVVFFFFFFWEHVFCGSEDERTKILAARMRSRQWIWTWMRYQKCPSDFNGRPLKLIVMSILINYGYK